ncbi:RICIN domain-containing protein [Diaminobutyricibacter sp. McL0618]|uniref:RICIN domain-containing protein n=1 Tax=Leifsonia sp. McL0618 TaxID=3415677 RepID=UPI003CEB47C1
MSPATGSWAAPPVLSGSLAGGASDQYCLRTTIGSVTGIPSASNVAVTVTANLNVANTWTSAASSTFTQTFVDNVAPSAPSALAGSSTTGTSVALTWQPSTDNVGVTGYVVKRNGTTVSTGTGTAFTDTGLTPFTSYNYTVSATDAAGNLSTPATVAVWIGPDTSATYTITNSSSSRCVDGNGAAYGSSGFQLLSRNCSTAASQKWSFQWVGSYLTITSNANLVWTVANNSTTAGDDVITQPTTGVGNQHWQVNPLAGGLYQFQSQSSGMCLQVPSKGNAVQLVQQICDANSPAQTFTVQ